MKEQPDECTNCGAEASLTFYEASFGRDDRWVCPYCEVAYTPNNDVVRSVAVMLNRLESRLMRGK